jgi:hypothetical protein
MTTDVVLAGAGYMVAPGTYKRGQDGVAEGRTGRVGIRDFFGGNHRAFQLERDRAGWDSLGVGPAFGGQGLEPWPYKETHTQDAASLSADKGRETPSVLIGTFGYIGWGRHILRTPSFGAGAWDDFTLLHSFGSQEVVTGLADYRGNLLVCLSTTADVVVITGPEGAGPFTPTVLLAGLKGQHAVGYANYAIISVARSLSAPGGATNQLKQTGPNGVDVRSLDAWIMNVGKFDGRVVAATRQALWTYTGKPLGTVGGTVTSDWSGDWQPFFQHGVFTEDDDYIFLQGYGGRLYTWLNKSVLEWNPHGERAGWRETGLTGLRCHGGCVAGGWLVVAIETNQGAGELWAWNGAGWWLLDRQSGYLPIWPTPLHGARNFDLLVWRDGSRTHDLYRLLWRGNTYHTLPPAGTFTTSLLDAGERDKDKAWRKIGAVFASPELRGVAGSADSVTVHLDYSTTSGATWQVAASQTLAGNTLANHNLKLEADIASDAAVGRFLQLRVRWTGVVDWAPVLAGVWTEFELLDSPARRRRWQFRVVARDQTVDRDGAPLPRTGRQLAADLWTAWQGGTTLAFRDLDYSAAPIERRVRIIGINEEIARPADAARWGDSVLALTLIEV